MYATMKLVGTRPLLMNNGRAADPLDPSAKAKAAVAKKRGKTDDDHAHLGRLEFAAALYHDDEVGPYLPADNLWKCIQVAARKSKQGKLIEEGLVVTSDINPLSYPGPRDLATLIKDKNFEFRKTVVQGGRTRIPRVRPIFQQWTTEADIDFDESVLNLGDLQRFADIGGRLVGLGDWRPRYGRFTATVVKA